VDLESLKTLLREDGIIENLQAILYLLGAVLWIYAFGAFKPGNKMDKRRRLFYFLFMAFFIFLFLEEISYGQRIFGITTPDSLKEINLQDETNIHNIGTEGTTKIIHILHAFLFALLGIIIPFLYLLSKKFGKLFRKMNFPIVNTNLIICFGISLNYYYEPGFHWSVPFRVLCLIIPIIIVVSRRSSWLLSQFKYPLFQIFILAITGFLFILLNMNPETNIYIENFIAWESRELFIALSLFLFAAFELGDVLKNKNELKSPETSSGLEEDAQPDQINNRSQ
jgi:hypothetical protein